MTIRRTLAALVVAVALAGCTSGGSDATPTSTRSAKDSTAPPTTSTPAEHVDSVREGCTKVRAAIARSGELTEPQRVNTARQLAEAMQSAGIFTQARYAALVELMITPGGGADGALTVLFRACTERGF